MSLCVLWLMHKQIKVAFDLRVAIYDSNLVLNRCLELQTFSGGWCWLVFENNTAAVTYS